MGRGMGDRSAREIIDIGRRDCRRAPMGDAAGGFGDEAPGHQGHRRFQRCDIAFEQHHIGQSGVEHLAQLVERVDLELDLDEMPGHRPRTARMPPASVM
jgi:hypothetical protein